MKLKEKIDLSELNPRFLMWSGVVILFICIALYPLFNQSEDIVINKTPIITQIEYIKILVTPTPDGITYFPNEYQSGERKILRPFSWIKKVDDLRSMKVTSIVYDYRFFDKLHWFSPMDSKFYELIPVDSLNNNFLLIFFNIYADEVIGDNVGYYLPSENMFKVIGKNIAYSPIEYKKQFWFKELEHTNDYNEVNKIKAYGQYYRYTSSKDAYKTGGYISIPVNNIKVGKYNGEDGYIIFEIPKNLKDEDILFSVSYSSFGWSAWRLKL
jgi:hypothetical protein